LPLAKKSTDAFKKMITQRKSDPPIFNGRGGTAVKKGRKGIDISDKNMLLYTMLMKIVNNST
jgi:hypothetical protein